MSNGRLDEELKIKIGRASAVFGEFCKVWKSKVSLKTKLRINNVVVIPTLQYDSKTWATTQPDHHRHYVVPPCKEYQGSRKNWPDPRVSPPQKHTARMVGHVCRMGPERLSKSLPSWIPESGKRRRGRYHPRWKDTIRRNAGYAGVEQDPKVAAAHSTQWQDVIALLVF